MRLGHRVLVYIIFGPFLEGRHSMLKLMLKKSSIPSWLLDSSLCFLVFQQLAFQQSLPFPGSKALVQAACAQQASITLSSDPFCKKLGHCRSSDLPRATVPSASPAMAEVPEQEKGSFVGGFRLSLWLESRAPKKPNKNFGLQGLTEQSQFDFFQRILAWATE